MPGSAKQQKPIRERLGDIVWLLEEAMRELANAKELAPEEAAGLRGKLIAAKDHTSRLASGREA